MKLTSLFFATTALFVISACGQDKEEPADTANDMTDEVEELTNVGDKVVAITDDVADTMAAGALIDPNVASTDVIAAIPGVGAELAQKIVSGRPYATPSELHAVLKDAADEDALKIIYSAMFVIVDLNTGSNADYQLIPTSLSPRKLAHEFEEYRPYSSMEQFSREMSKYVSAEEVANLRRYVTIN